MIPSKPTKSFHIFLDLLKFGWNLGNPTSRKQNGHAKHFGRFILKKVFRQTHKAIDSESLRELTFRRSRLLPETELRRCAARFRAVASRIRLRKRNDVGVASTYSSMSMYSIARSRLMRSGASS